MSHTELKDVCKTYRLGANVVIALCNFSVEIETGEFAVILGPSGRGKTTFLNILGEQLQPIPAILGIGGLLLMVMLAAILGLRGVQKMDKSANRSRFEGDSHERP